MWHVSDKDWEALTSRSKVLTFADTPNLPYLWNLTPDFPWNVHWNNTARWCKNTAMPIFELLPCWKTASINVKSQSHIKKWLEHFRWFIQFFCPKRLVDVPNYNCTLFHLPLRSGHLISTSIFSNWLIHHVLCMSGLKIYVVPVSDMFQISKEGANFRWTLMFT